MGISLGLVGLGAFGKGFADLFKKHPAVARVGLCDREAERMEFFASQEAWDDKFDRRDMYESLDDIVDACANILEYARTTSREDFLAGGMAFDAIVRNLEIIGEAVKHLPEGFRAQHPEVDWKRIAGLRDLLAHAYFGVDPLTLWGIVEGKIPGLLQEVQAIVSRME